MALSQPVWNHINVGQIQSKHPLEQLEPARDVTPMILSEFTRLLKKHPEYHLLFVLPGNEEIPPHFHITEVGRVDKRFIDCGGTKRELSFCCLQAWVADQDESHRLPAGKLAHIIENASSALGSDELDVEIEYEDCCILCQYPIAELQIQEGLLRFHLTSKHTDCLARDVCFPNGCNESGRCC